MNPSLFTITAQTNLHVGSGDANYGIIDKLVQRDALTDLPTIHASSLKGAVLQHFFKQSGVSDDYIDEVFGRQNSKSKRRNPAVNSDSKNGEFVFMQAQLLSMPVRSDKRAFFRATCSSLLTDLRQMALDLGLANEGDELAQALATVASEAGTKAVALSVEHKGTCHLEDEKNVELKLSTLQGNGLNKLKNLLGGAEAVVLPDDMFRRLCDNHHLPVVARNHLENGQSTNLWYEQVLPRQSRFAAFVLRPERPRLATDFDTRLTQNNYVQIGANASVGYGYCSVQTFNW